MAARDIGRNGTGAARMALVGTVRAAVPTAAVRTGETAVRAEPAVPRQPRRAITTKAWA